MSFRIRVLDAADEDVDAVTDWLLQHSPAGARAWYEAYLAALELIARSADSFAIFPQSKRLRREVRMCVFGTAVGRRYVLLFEIDSNKQDVRILRVRSPGQRPVRNRDLPRE